MLPTINRVCEKGLANKSLDKAKFMSLEIPLPPLDVQARIAAELDALERDAAKYEESAAAVERTQRALLIEVEAAPKTRLGDVCMFKAGKSITKAQLREGPFPVVGGGVGPMGHHAEYNTEANVTIVSTTGAGAGRQCSSGARWDYRARLHAPCPGTSQSFDANDENGRRAAALG
jgi:restriction endonuclease S subunit